MGHLSKADLQALANQLAALKRQAQAEVDAANAEFAQDQADGDQDVGQWPTKPKSCGCMKFAMEN